MNANLIRLCAAFYLFAQSAFAAELQEPIPVQVGDEILDVEHVGHAAPFVGDFDNDGVKDLLVGEFFKGRLRVYRNVGTRSNPRFDSYRVFQDGASTGCIYAS